MNEATWLDAFGHQLEALGVAVDERAAVLVETEGFLAESDVSALDHFGPPDDYAAAVASALGHRSGRAASPVAAGDAVVVAVDGVTKSYRGHEVLGGVSLRATVGEVVVLIGPNGAGKSTLLRLVAGIERPDAGSVRVSGRIGYVPQSGGLDPYLTPCEHFALFGAPNGLDRAGATAEGCRLARELGWDAAAAAVAGELSGGTGQKLSVVTALLGSPALLLLDEPYQGMDADSTRRFWDLLWSWQDSGGTAVVASHSPDALAKASTVIEIEGMPTP